MQIFCLFNISVSHITRLAMFEFRWIKYLSSFTCITQWLLANSFSLRGKNMLNKHTKVVWITFTFEVTSRDISPQHVTLPANFYLFPLRYRDRGRYFITIRSRVRLKILRAKRTSCLLLGIFCFRIKKKQQQK